MKIIHCADLHLDLKMLSGLDAEKRKIKRTQLLQNFFNLLDYANKNTVEAVLLCGDIFDTQEPTKKTLSLFKNAILNHNNIKFFYIWGNHDKKVMPFSSDEMPENFYVFKEDFSAIDLDENVTIGGASLDRFVKDNFYSTINFDKNRVNILMLHQPINTSDQYFNGVYTYNLAGKYIDYLALGHIHQSLSGKIDDRGVWQYSGALEGKSFNDAVPIGSKKGFFLLNIKNGKLDFQFVPFSLYDYRIVEIPVDLQDDHFKVLEKMENVLKYLGKTDIVRVILKGKHKEENVFQLDLMYQKFKNNFFNFEIVDNTETEFDFEKYSLETFSLKGEFLRTVRDSELSQSEKDKISLIGIEALKGEDITL